MSKVDFYILESSSKQKAWHYACLWLEQIVVENKRVYINMESSEDANALDLLMWTYRDDSFLPHCIYTAKEEFPAAIQIGVSNTPPLSTEMTHDILLNFAQHLPSFHSHFSQIVEIVSADTLAQEWARLRYKQYREQGYNMNTIKLKADAL